MTTRVGTPYYIAPEGENLLYHPVSPYINTVVGIAVGFPGHLTVVVDF